MNYYRFQLPGLISRTLAICLLLGLSSGLWAAPDGQALYGKYCASCHQSEGKGGIGLPLLTEKLAQVSDRYLVKTIRIGRPGRVMPGFDHLSDAQVDAVVRYLRGWTGRPGPVFSQETISGDPIKGGVLFGRHCAKCHGIDGSGEGIGTGVTLSRERSFLVMPPSVTNAGFLASASDELIKHTILHGRSGSLPMPAFKDKNLDDKEINSLVAFVRSQQKPLRVRHDDTRVTMAPSHIVESPYDMETTINNVRAAITGSNFRVFPERFLEQGLTDEFSVNKKQLGLRFCNFRSMYKMIRIEPRLGVVLPCRITVMERADGQVILVAPNFGAISLWFNNDEMLEIGAEIEEALLDILEEAVL